MSIEPIITVSGLRGIVGASLTPEVACRYVAAYLAETPPGPIVVTRDGRASGPALAEAIGRALVNLGRRCLDGGVAATPTTGILVRSLQAAGGIQISASHNPAEYNGIKLFSAAGRVLPADAGSRVLAHYQAKTPVAAPADRDNASPRTGSVERLDDATSAHLGLVEGVCDVDRIRRQAFRVVLDATHGAGSLLGMLLLERLGCRVTMIGGEPDGQFEHPPEPTEANLAAVLPRVAQQGACVGFCQDPDADRLAIVDERGRYIGEEKTLALCVDHVLRAGARGPVVTNCSTSRMTEDLAHQYGVPFFRSRVGEANVVDRMLAENALLGGEGNGGVIDPRVGLVRDSFAGMALVLDALAARGASLSALADELPQYAICKTTIAVPSDRIAAAFAALTSRFAEATADRMDGLRLDWPDGRWLLVRASNTEPIVRAIAEARTPAAAKELCDLAAAVVSS